MSHNKKWIFGVLIVAFVCLAFSPAVAAETVTKELYVEDTLLYGEIDNAVLALANSNIEPSERLGLQEELGNLLFSADPDTHEAIIQQYHAAHPELSTPQTDGNTYVYTYGDRLIVTFMPDGSLLTTTHSVEEHGIFSSRAITQGTDIHTVTHSDLGVLWQPHTIVELKGWFEYDYSSYPIAHLISFGTTLLPDDREVILSTTQDVELPSYSTKLSGELQTAYKTNGDGIYHYYLELTCDTYGHVESSSQKY